jgi:mannose-1-phosphate guanylyltransferase/mannose-6-phosphate isomerase
MILPVILAGGSGERLWPLSRTAYPKQFLALLGAKHSLFQATIQRLAENANFLAPLVICHEDYRFIVAEQLRQIDTQASGIILEPSANNTAPAIALAAQWTQANFINPILLVLPADHFIQDEVAFQQAITQAQVAAEQNFLVTFGIHTSKAETGYGYIHVGDKLDQTQGYHVAKFIEKPDQATANQLVQDPAYVWNSGMFMFGAQNYLNELQIYQPAIVQATQDAIANCTPDLDFIRPRKDCYQNCPSISIDYAVMEHTEHAAVFTLMCQWSDIGSWQAVWEQSAKDNDGNALSGDIIAHQTSNCVVEARHRLVATLDVHDLAIVETADAILIASREQSQALKKIVSELKQASHPAATEHRQVMRPWGWYDSLAKSERFQVKHIVVDPGKSLSLQLHQQRSEHWVIVKGSAKVVRGEQSFMLQENESTFIPLGVKHQLTNIGSIPLELIEVQSGSYLGEDDIIRFNDEHGRATVNEQEYVAS